MGIHRGNIEGLMGVSREYGNVGLIYWPYRIQIGNEGMYYIGVMAGLYSSVLY